MNNSMNYIYEVYKEKSISQAAKNLYITQPALSACIKKVESEIGLQLFDRNTLPIRLTEAGELYIQAIQKIQAVEKELSQKLLELSNLERGKVAISGANFFSSYILPPIIHEFTKRYPGIDVELTESESNNLYEMALMDNIDLILDAGTYDDNLFDSEFLCREQIFFAVPMNNKLNETYKSYAFTVDDIIANKHINSSVKPITIEAFKDERFVLLKKGHDMHRRSISICEQAGFKPQNAMYLSQLSTSARISAEGLGCCFITDTLIKRIPLVKDSLLFYALDSEEAHRDMYIAFQNKTHKTKAMKQFLSLAQEMFNTND